MKGAALRAEMRAALSGMSDASIDLLLHHGVDRADIGLGLVGSALVRVEGDYYSPDPDGRPAFLTPIRVHDVVTPESSVPDSAVRVGSLVDIIAWHPLRPDRWALRTGAAEWLGAIEPQYMSPAPSPIRRSVLGWFQANCTGLLPTYHAPADLFRLLSWCIGGIVAEDAQHAAELRRALARPLSAPRISVAAGTPRHAA